MRRSSLWCLVPVFWLWLFGGSAFGSFGIKTFDSSFTEADGAPVTQAGSHPWAFTTSFDVNEHVNLRGFPVPDGDVRDVDEELPQGVIGNPDAAVKCSVQQFNTRIPEEDIQRPGSSFERSGASCPLSSQVGVAEFATTEEPLFAIGLPVYNLATTPNEPAQLGFNYAGIPIVFTPNVRTDKDYGISVDVKEASQDLYIYGVKVTLWGVPADPAHDALRGECLPLYPQFFKTELGIESLIGEPGTPCSTDAPKRPFLTMPTTCSGTPLRTSLHLDSWQEVGNTNTDGSPDLNDPRWKTAVAESPAITGCEKLDFSPSSTVQPDSSAASSPTGVAVDVKLPYNNDANGLAESNLREAVVTLPAGVAISPSAADGLGACTDEPEAGRPEGQIALHSSEPATCPDASKIGTVEIQTPLLEKPLEGAVYLAQQERNPFKAMFAIYVVAEGSGVAVKLAGDVEADPMTGRLTTTFKENPELPLEELKLSLFGGPRAALATPSACGTYTASSVLAPWSGTEAHNLSNAFEINADCSGGFAPSLVAGTINNQAGGFSPFTTTISRSDQHQQLKGVTIETPPGLLGMLAKVPLCEEPQAAAGTCSQASHIGHVTVGAGVGPDPVFLPQVGRREDPVFLTGPYQGAPFGLTIVEHAEAGPFNLGDIVVRAAVSVDPHTAQITIKSDELPTIEKGVPLDVRTINVTVDREGFMFNPTNCEPLAATGTIISTQNITVGVSNRFEAANCATLPFKPSFTVSTGAKTSHANGASLAVKIGYPKGTQANIRKVAVSLPKALPSRLTTIQKACPEATFAANPASCPAGSNIGGVKATTPVLNVPLVGPVYLVSHGGAAFPDLDMVLQGQGVTLDVVGSINISKASITSSAFNAVPDAPISSFELKLPVGAHSALTANLPKKANHSLCGSNLIMPTTITGQNGAVIKQSTKIAVTGCPKKKKAHKPKAARKKKK